jgi:hypothetical protein
MASLPVGEAALWSLAVLFLLSLCLWFDQRENGREETSVPANSKRPKGCFADGKRSHLGAATPERSKQQQGITEEKRAHFDQRTKRKPDLPGPSVCFATRKKPFRNKAIFRYFAN